MNKMPNFSISVNIDILSIARSMRYLTKVPGQEGLSGLDYVAWRIENLRYVSRCELGHFNFVKLDLDTKRWDIAQKRQAEAWERIMRRLKHYNKIGERIAGRNNQ